MPGKERSVLSEREEMVARYRNGAPVARLARDDAVSRKTIRKWIGRATSGADDALGDRSRRPHAFPRRTPEPVRLQVLELAEAHPTWGGRKLYHALRQQGQAAVPAPSTITKLLRQEGRLQQVPPAPTAWTRFEAAAPNDLWQLDVKGSHALRAGTITPLTLLDDHRRFLLEVRGLQSLTFRDIQPVLTACFQRSGLPLVDPVRQRATVGHLGTPGPDPVRGLVHAVEYSARAGTPPSPPNPRQAGALAPDAQGGRLCRDSVPGSGHRAGGVRCLPAHLQPRPAPRSPRPAPARESLRRQ